MSEGIKQLIQCEKEAKNIVDNAKISAENILRQAIKDSEKVCLEYHKELEIDLEKFKTGIEENLNQLRKRTKIKLKNKNKFIESKNYDEVIKEIEEIINK